MSDNMKVRLLRKRKFKDYADEDDNEKQEITEEVYSASGWGLPKGVTVFVQSYGDGESWYSELYMPDDLTREQGQYVMELLNFEGHYAGPGGGFSNVSKTHASKLPGWVEVSMSGGLDI